MGFHIVQPEETNAKTHIDIRFFKDIKPGEMFIRNREWAYDYGLSRGIVKPYIKLNNDYSTKTNNALALRRVLGIWTGVIISDDDVCFVVDPVDLIISYHQTNLQEEKQI